MTTDDLIARYQLLADDAVGSTRLTDDDVRGFLLEAEQEAAIRGRLIQDVATLPVTAGSAMVNMDAAFYEIAHLSFLDADGGRHPVKLVSAEALDQALREDPSRIVAPQGTGYDINLNLNDGRDATGNPPLYAIQSDLTLRLAPIPTADGSLHLEGYRVPVREADDDPEIGAIHHAHLVQWVIYRRFSITDEDHFDGKRADVAYAEFERYFGPRPDSDLRRATRHDTPHHVQPFFI